MVSKYSSSFFLLLVTLSGLHGAEKPAAATNPSNANKAILVSSTSSQVKPKASNDDSKEKYQTASQSLFGYNQNGQTNGLYSGGSFGGFSGSNGGFGQPFGSNNFGVNSGGGLNSGGLNSGLNSNGFGGAFAGNRDNGLYTGTNQLNGFSGLGGPSSGGFNGQFGSFNGQGFYPGSNTLGNGFGGSNGLYSGQGNLFNNGLYQNGLYQNGAGFNSYPQFGGGNGFNQLGGGTFGGTQDRNLGFVNQAFGNPLYNRSPAVTNVQPNLGSLQVGNRIDVNNNRGQLGNYIPSGGQGGFSIQNGQQQGSPSGLYPGAIGFGNTGQPGGAFGGFQGSRGYYPGGGFNNNPNPYLTLDYLNRTPLRGGSSPGSPTSTVPPRSTSRLGAGRVAASPNSRFYPSGPPSYPSGRGERLHRFTSTSDEDSKK